MRRGTAKQTSQSEVVGRAGVRLQVARFLKSQRTYFVAAMLADGTTENHRILQSQEGKGLQLGDWGPKIVIFRTVSETRCITSYERAALA